MSGTHPHIHHNGNTEFCLSSCCVCLSHIHFVRVCVCVHHEGPWLVECVPLLAVCVRVFRSQCLAEAETPLIGSGRSGLLGSAPRPSRPCPCLADPPQWGLLLHPRSTHTPKHIHRANIKYITYY